MKMAESGNIRAVVYDEQYRGLEDIPRALDDLHHRKVIGRAVVTITDKDVEVEQKSKM